METKTEHEALAPHILAGKRVALARAAGERNSPAAYLTSLGAEVVYYPCLELLPPANQAELDLTLQQLAGGEFDWLVLTTASAVMALAERLEQLQIPPRQLQRVKVAAYGANTRLAAHDLLQLDVGRVPEVAAHADLVKVMRAAPGSRILLPLAAGQRADWANLLAADGVQVTTVAAYRAMMGHGGDEVPVMLWSGDIDAIAFTSECNVRYFAKRLQYEGGTLAMLDHVCIACIEPQTAVAARSIGLHVDVVPRDHTPAALAAALAGYFERRR
jgi:uroporphyrinogen-III synthase